MPLKLKEKRLSLGSKYTFENRSRLSLGGTYVLENIS